VTFDELVAPFPPAVQETAHRLLAIARGLIPNATESGDGGDYGIGTGPGYKRLVFVISPHEKWVTLGIARGASLEDPEGLLKGRGKVHRHVKLKDPQAADAPALRDLMRRAAG
jgi:hypothetical protein